MKLLKLDLGCGRVPQKGYLGIDNFYKSKNIIKSDVLKYLKKLPKNSCSHIYSRHYLEHVDKKQIFQILKEINRILIKNGKIVFIVPHFSNPYFFSDLTHKIFFGIHTFNYICETSCLKRKVPKYIEIKNWHLLNVRVNFISIINIKFLGIKLPTLATFLKVFVNSSNLFIEIYERYLCNFFSIYEIKFEIQKK